MGKRGEILQSQVLSALKEADTPLSAYDILHALREDNPKMAPTTIYRVLGTLTEKGMIHRLESLNAYMLCQGDDPHHDAIISICDDCGSVKEMVAPELLESMAKVVEKSGFAPTRHVVEVHGTCADCGLEQTATS